MAGDSASMKIVSKCRGLERIPLTILSLELFFDMNLQVTFQSKRELLQRTETQVVEVQALPAGPPSLRGSVSFYNSVGLSP